MPRIDISGETSTEEIKLMDMIYQDKHGALKKVLIYLAKELHLTYKEALPLMAHIYNAAEKTLEKSEAITRDKTHLTAEVDPRRKDLAYQIGVDIQKFRGMFRSLLSASGENRKKRYSEAKEFLEPIVTDLFYQANIVLADTPIPRLMDELHNQFIRFWMATDGLFASHEERFGFTKFNLPVPRDIIDRISALEQSLDKTVTEIENLIDQLIESCKELK